MRIQITTQFEPIGGNAEAKFTKAAAVALTRTAWDTREALMRGMQGAFDRPTPFTMRAFRVEAARSATLEATVYAAPLQARYLQFEVDGGERNTKGFEKKLQLFGGKVAIPAAGAKLNQYGNMSMSFIKSATSGGKVAKGRSFFVGDPKGKAGQTGVWARVNGNKRIIPVMMFADGARYATRFDMPAIAGQTVDQRFASQLMRALDRA